MVFGLRVGSFITDPHSFRESLSDNICRRPVTGEHGCHVHTSTDHHGCHVHTSTLVDFSPALGRTGNRENVYVATIGGTLAASVQEPPNVVSKDRILLGVRKGKAPNTLDGQGKRIACVRCIGAHDHVLHTEVFNRLEDPMR